MDAHLSISVGELDCVSDQVDQHLLDAVDINFKAFLWHIRIKAESNLLVGGLHFHNLNDLFNYLIQVLQRVIRYQAFLFEQAPVQQIFHLVLYHVGTMLNHF